MMMILSACTAQVLSPLSGIEDDDTICRCIYTHLETVQIEIANKKICLMEMLHLKKKNPYNLKSFNGCMRSYFGVILRWGFLTQYLVCFPECEGRHAGTGLREGGNRLRGDRQPALWPARLP